MSKPELAEGILSLPTFGNDVVIIEELPMSKYEKFYRYWLAAMEICKDNPESNFVSLWCSHEGFRKLMWKAMVTLGIEDPGSLSPKTMQALLVLNDGGPGLAFRLHEEIPVVTPGKPKKKTPKKRGFLKRLQNSISEGISRLSFWATQTLYMSGAYVAL